MSGAARATILEGAVLDRLRDLPTGSVQTVVTSPPYHAQRDYQTPGQIGLEATVDDHLEKLVEVFDEVARVLRVDGTAWVNYGDGYRDKQLQGLPWRVAFALQGAGCFLRSEIIWGKAAPMPESANDRPHKSHEQVFLFSHPRSRGAYYYDADAVRNSNGLDRDPVVGDEITGRHLLDVWWISTQADPFRASSTDAHFATFPEKLVEPCVKAGTSARGACPECGAPWARVVDRDVSECDTEWSTVRDVTNPDEIAAYLKRNRERLGKTRRQVDDYLGTTTLYSWFEGRPAGIETPTVEQWEKLKTVLELDDRHDEDVARTKEVEVTVYKKGASVEDLGSAGDYIAPFQFGAAPRRTTTGWAPTCDHGDGLEVEPCVVLDPCAGAGTTLLVALRLGCRAIGIEINPEYAEIARRRIRVEAEQSRIF